MKGNSNMTIKENIAYMKHFGINLTFWKTVNQILRSVSKGSIAWKIHDINNEKIEKFICEKCTRTMKSALSDEFVDDKTNINEMPNSIRRDIQINKTIWIMWWQGEKNAPPIVRACIESVRKNSNGHPVVIIDESNYKKYISIPDYILNRYEEGKKDKTKLKDTVLSITHFSDIIRSLLLYQYGGIWVDATIFFTDIIPENYFTNELTTLGEDNEWFIGRGKWSIWFIGCQAGNMLMKFIYQMHAEYLENEKYWVNYLMVYSIMDIAYKKIPTLRKLLEVETHGNNKALTINRLYNEEVDASKIEEFLKHQCIHKLSWKWCNNDINIPLNIKTENGKLTYLGYMYEKYVDKNKR